MSENVSPNQPSRSLGSYFRLLLFAFLILVAITVTATATSADDDSNRSYQSAPDVLNKPMFLVADNQSIAEDPPSNSLNCRYGTAANGRLAQWLDMLHVGWFTNFNSSGSDGPSGQEFVHIVRIRQDKNNSGGYLPTYTYQPPRATLENLIANNPGDLWVIGNEPDVEAQDDMFPTIYAEAYHELYHLIKQTDPTAQVGSAGLVQLTPARLQYYDIVYDTYQQLYDRAMPDDVWTAHVYTLPEINPNGTPSSADIPHGVHPSLGIVSGASTPHLCNNPNDNVFCYAEHDDVTIFGNQIHAMRQWMKERGHQNKPLIITEFSILYPYEIDVDGQGNQIGCFLQDELGNCFTPQRVSSYLNDTFAYLEDARDTSIGYPGDNYRLVQQWNWFMTHNYGVGEVSNLLQDNFADFVPGDPQGLTVIGNAYRDFVAAEPLGVDMRIGRMWASPAEAGPDGLADVTLYAEIYNRGNTMAQQPVTVTFYKTSTTQFPIGSVTFTPPLHGCARRAYVASVVLEDVQVGVRRFYAEVDAIDAGFDDTSDNGSNALMYVGNYLTYLPLTHGGN